MFLSTSVRRLPAVVSTDKWRRGLRRWLAIGLLPLAVHSIQAGSASAPDKVAATDNALVNALVKKGVLSNEEAKSISDDLDKQYQATPGGFLSVGSKAVTGLKLYGDMRLRYEYDHLRNASGDNRERTRYRYRVRVGAEYTFTENFSSGLRLGTGQARNSTYGDGGTGNASYNSNDTLYVDLVYLDWKKAFGADWLALTAGRMVQPHNLTSNWTWDSDINPDGGVIKLGEWKATDHFSIGSTHGAYVWTDQMDNGFAADGFNDVWLFINQVDFGYKFGKDWKFRLSPGFVSAIGDGKAGIGGTTNFNDVSDLNVLSVNASLSTPFFIKGTKGSLYGEYGVNLTADDMGERLLTNHDGGDNQYFVIGYKVSAGKGKGSWSVDATYAYFEALSWSGALVDSSFNGGKLNGHGFGVQVAYGLTDNITTSVNYRKSWSINDNLTGSAAADLGGTQDGTDLVQVDLTWKF
jgi:hypothetical protein